MNDIKKAIIVKWKKDISDEWQVQCHLLIVWSSGEQDSWLAKVDSCVGRLKKQTSVDFAFDLDASVIREFKVVGDLIAAVALSFKVFDGGVV